MQLLNGSTLKRFGTALAGCLVVVGGHLAHGAEISEDFKDGKFNIAKYMGEKVSIASEGRGGAGDGSLRTVFDANGHGAYVTEIAVPANIQAQTIYFSYDIKVSNGAAYQAWSSKHLKFRAINSSTGCYWQTTDRWDIAMYGADNTCQRDAQNNIQPKDLLTSARTGVLSVVKSPSTVFSFKDNTWYNWKVMVKANDLGQQNGEIQMWLDGQVYWHVKNIDLRDKSMGWYINQIDLGGYTSGNPGVAATVWIDNVKISSSQIESEDEAPPAAPILKLSSSY